MFELLDIVRLKKDDGVAGVSTAHIGTIVDIVSDHEYTVEFIDENNETIAASVMNTYDFEDLVKA